MDEMSLKILRILQKQPDLTVAEIGERVGLSHTPCWRRIKEMERDGVIMGRTDPPRSRARSASMSRCSASSA